MAAFAGSAVSVHWMACPHRCRARPPAMILRRATPLGALGWCPWHLPAQAGSADQRHRLFPSARAASAWLLFRLGHLRLVVQKSRRPGQACSAVQKSFTSVENIFLVIWGCYLGLPFMENRFISWRRLSSFAPRARPAAFSPIPHNLLACRSGRENRGRSPWPLPLSSSFTWLMLIRRLAAHTAHQSPQAWTRPEAWVGMAFSSTALFLFTYSASHVSWG